MTKYLALLVAFIFVAVQTVDIGVLDAAHAATLDVHDQSDTDNAPLPGDPDNCALHCGCHTLHHLSAMDSAAELALSFDAGRKFAFQSLGARDFDRGPPVPPPLA